MPRILVIDRMGSAHAIDGEAGRSLMETLRDAGLPVEAACGGCCSCATCHVYVDADWRSKVGPRGDVEHALLSLSDSLDGDASRLSCQILLNGGLDGLKVTLAPED